MKNIIIGIAGGTGSGKTTIAKALQKKCNENDLLIIKQDSYYKDLKHLPFKKRNEKNFDHPNALDFNLLVKHLKKLKTGSSIDVPDYNFLKHIRNQKTINCASKKIIIVEGILVLHHPGLRELLSIKVFLDIPPDIRLIRRINRDLKNRGRSINSITKQYLYTVRPMHKQFVDPSKKYADIIIDEKKSIESTISCLISKIKSLNI
tara:strand:- start:405 stop:1019 length:615 start_codon:yes stop_codon:yes gene_type:complete